jgi:hypothetical protein
LKIGHFLPGRGPKNLFSFASCKIASSGSSSVAAVMLRALLPREHRIHYLPPRL